MLYAIFSKTFVKGIASLSFPKSPNCSVIFFFLIICVINSIIPIPILIKIKEIINELLNGDFGL